MTIQLLQIKQIVEVIDANTYLIKLDSHSQQRSIPINKQFEFEDFDVWTDCNVGVSLQRIILSFIAHLSTAGPYPKLQLVTFTNVNYLLLDLPIAAHTSS
jgi:hypothetical protein